MRVTRAALVWVFGVAATLLGVGPFGGAANSLDDEQVLAAATASTDASTNPVRETKAPTPAIGTHLADLDLAVPDLAPHVTPAPIVADRAVRPARAPPASTRA